MCGIIYVKRKDNKPAYKSVMKRYRNQAQRGQDGFGYVAMKDNKIVSYHRAQTEQEIRRLIEKEDAPEILFHHRFPTSTANVAEAAHPIYVANPEKLDQHYFIVHNGVIGNAEELREEHEKDGFKYVTELSTYVRAASGKEYETGTEFNDSEALAIETAKAIDGASKFIGSRGAAAVIGIKVDDEGNVLDRFVFRNDVNPLHHTTDSIMTCITSIGKGEMVNHKKVMQLQEDGTLIIHPRDLFTPWSYRSSSYPSAPYASSYDKDYSGGKFSGTNPPPDVPARFLTAGESRMGFGAHDDEDDFEYTEPTDQDLGIPPALPPSIGLILEKREIGALEKFRVTFRQLGLAEMWDIYEKMDLRNKELDADVLQLDDKIWGATGDRLIELQDDRAEIQAQLDLMLRLIPEAERVITEREATLNLTRRDEPKTGSLLA